MWNELASQTNLLTFSLSYPVLTPILKRYGHKNSFPLKDEKHNL
jgi:hypothetical protein